MWQRSTSPRRIWARSSRPFERSVLRFSVRARWAAGHGTWLGAARLGRENTAGSTNPDPDPAAAGVIGGDAMKPGPLRGARQRCKGSCESVLLPLAGPPVSNGEWTARDGGGPSARTRVEPEGHRKAPPPVLKASHRRMWGFCFGSTTPDRYERSGLGPQSLCRRATGGSPFGCICPASRQPHLRALHRSGL